MIELTDVYFSYEAKKPVLQGISLTIKEGAWLTVLGHNGGGKTTLALLLNGLLLPSRGQVTVDGLATCQSGNLGAIRRSVAFVFQNPDNQIVGATVEEDVAFGPCNLGLPRREVARRVDKALSLLALNDYRQHAPHMLSGGQKQKVALAGALAMVTWETISSNPTPLPPRATPFTVIHPLEGREPFKCCKKVDFPEPEAPITPKNSPSATVKLTFFRACRAKEVPG